MEDIHITFFQFISTSSFSKVWTLVNLNKFCFEMFTMAQEVEMNIFCHGTFKKLSRNSENSTSDKFENLSVLSIILYFLSKIYL